MTTLHSQSAKLVPRLREIFLPFALPEIDEAEYELVREVLESGWITTGLAPSSSTKRDCSGL